MQHSPQADYTMMRVAMQMFDKPLQQLEDEERAKVMQQANREMAIGKKLLDSDAAAAVVIPESAVHNSLQELRQRFDSDEAFDQALEQNGLDRESLHEALIHELKVEAVLEQVLSEKARVSDEEIEIYYYQHLDKFELPETRTARHILITINEDYAENSPEAAHERLTEIQHKVASGEASFNDMAGKYSECPTAMHDGLLGRVKPGQLYSELEQVLFEMEEGSYSDIVQSPMGLHLLYCEKVHQAGRVEFDEVRDRLCEYIEKKKRTRLLKEWLQEAA